jgi:hypothetical protein
MVRLLGTRCLTFLLDSLRGNPFSQFIEVLPRKFQNNAVRVHPFHVFERDDFRLPPSPAVMHNETSDTVRIIFGDERGYSARLFTTGDEYAATDRRYVLLGHNVILSRDGNTVYAVRREQMPNLGIGPGN